MKNTNRVKKRKTRTRKQKRQLVESRAVVEARERTLLHFADKHKENPTSAEALFLSCVCQPMFLEYGIEFETQQVVFPTPRVGYIVDFYFPAWKLAVELDGAQHYTPKGRKADMRRTKALKGIGIGVFRYPNSVVLAHPRRILDDLIDRFYVRPDYDSATLTAFDYAIAKDE